MANSRKIRSLELEFTWNGTQLSIMTSQGLLPSVYLFPPLDVSYRVGLVRDILFYLDTQFRRT